MRVRLVDIMDAEGVIQYTPGKINMEPENYWVGEENSFPIQRSIFRFHVELPKCNSLMRELLLFAYAPGARNVLM